MTGLKNLVATTSTTTTTTRVFHPSPHLKMASSTTDFPYKMHITPDNTGLWHVKQTDEAAKKVSELLQEDLEVSQPLSLFTCHPFSLTHPPTQKHHVFFNKDGFHNHVNVPPLTPLASLYLIHPPDPAPPPSPLRHRRPRVLPHQSLHH